MQAARITWLADPKKEFPAFKKLLKGEKKKKEEASSLRLPGARVNVCVDLSVRACVSVCKSCVRLCERSVNSPFCGVVVYSPAQKREQDYLEFARTWPPVYLSWVLKYVETVFLPPKDPRCKNNVA